MLRLCILSNSHGGAIKAAWTEGLGEQGLGVIPTFFAATGTHMKHLRQEGGCLTTPDPELRDQLRRTSGGLAQIDPADFDAFWIHGLGFAQLTWPKPESAHYSRGFLTALTVARIQDSLAMRVHALLRALTEKPIVLSVDPMYAEAVAPLDEAAVPEPPTAEDLTPPLCALVGAGTTFNFQPTDTITRRYYTAHAFSEHSARLHVSAADGSEQHSERDFRHMNARYGERVWRQVLARLPRR